jgi:hypothetical protein
MQTRSELQCIKCLRGTYTAFLLQAFTQSNSTNTVMCHLTMGIRSEKCIVRRFRRRANVIQCTYTNLDGILPTTHRRTQQCIYHK